MDIIAFRLHTAHSVAVPPGCALFVRSGAAAWQTRSSDVLLDPNHCLLVPRDSAPTALTACGGPASITIFHEPRIDFGAKPSARIIDSSLFAQHFCLTLLPGGACARPRVARLIERVRSAREKPATLSAHSPSYGRIMQRYVNNEIAQPTRLDDVARAAALSPFTASRVFHRELGLPLRIYNRRLRLRTALARIADQHALSDVALELGFFDHAHFSKTFRTEFDMTPSEWRDYVLAAFNAAA